MGLFNLSSLDTTVPQGVSVFLFYALGLSIMFFFGCNIY
ncbi:hypothetical protein AZO1586I_2250 [Bathymodiolus thermophilus thioautotrophic gill symbiont]|uniref:Secreted protein n=2 Tax=sulfur-oxidizing symbionts TaxID=32036 RepID=A0A1H6K8Z8_9GAMM|nr:hypothetical protein AZO1586I_2250 [Bathymodiolus thermophilus thioautotrophic gill symbiont]CAC5834457.1 hypothetical protein [uncultured Gammaproteobacteria bacterium]SEH71766.1 hypothetical protein BAZSYMB_SCAFFOLD00003_6 [Bathymodiolus azoricus thioautotrophic gill symbiont]CAC9506874.1 hypothetical protein [uncultured Gammaproteobacteria bacterium]CAC9510387.1 hypothetical protein [uncultured Gammaproteobacteria bacterium]